MKKLLTLLFVVMSAIFITNTSCEEDKPLCEQNNFCKVTIRNNTSISLWVDCTEPGDDFNSEKRVMPGASVTYTMIPGSLTVWAASDGNRTLNRWNYDDIYVNQCQEYTFTWNAGKGASSVESDKNGTYNDDGKTSCKTAQ